MRNTKLIAVVIVALTVIVGANSYNTLLTLDEGVTKSWADLDSTLVRRYDLIPNLVNTVKGYAAHEKETFQAVTEARAKATSMTLDASTLDSPEKMAALANSQQQLSQALGRLLLVVEKYPELKADKNFLDLQHQLEGTENRINYARQEVNSAVMQFNAAIRRFPNNIINSMFLGLEKRQPFAAQAEQKAAPKVDFSQ